MASLYDVVDALGALRSEVKGAAEDAKAATEEYERLASAAAAAEEMTSTTTSGRDGSVGGFIGSSSSSGDSYVSVKGMARAAAAARRGAL